MKSNLNEVDLAQILEAVKTQQVTWLEVTEFNGLRTGICSFNNKTYEVTEYFEDLVGIDVK